MKFGWKRKKNNPNRNSIRYELFINSVVSSLPACLQSRVKRFISKKCSSWLERNPSSAYFPLVLSLCSRYVMSPIDAWLPGWLIGWLAALQSQRHCAYGTHTQNEWPSRWPTGSICGRRLQSVPLAHYLCMSPDNDAINIKSCKDALTVGGFSCSFQGCF